MSINFKKLLSLVIFNLLCNFIRLDSVAVTLSIECECRKQDIYCIIINKSYIILSLVYHKIFFLYIK